MWNKVFIIGNGFDISLGYKTKYSEFASSNYWPFHNVSIFGLDGRLNYQKQVEKWLDIESELLKYATPNENDERVRSSAVINNVENDKQSFNLLCQKLEQYISFVQDSTPINKDSIAIKVLDAVLDNGYFSKIFTFNYTNLAKIAKSIGINHVDFEYVHGSTEHSDSILGVQDKVNLKNGYDFLYKTFNKNYPSCAIQYALQECNEVIIYGHSLGEVDYHYFKDFFSAQCREGMTRIDSKKITIFTWDNYSRLNILRHNFGI